MSRIEARPRAAYLVLVLATIGVALLGYVGYVLYPRFDLPAGMGASLMLLAAAAGVASFFSPCGFPLLASVVARDLSQRTGVKGQRSGFRMASWLSLGAAAFVIVTGSLIALGAGSLFRTVTFTSAPGIAIRAVVGTLLVVLGLIQIGVLRSPFGAVEATIRPLLARQAALRRDRPALGFAALGFGYLLAGFG